MLEPEPDSTKWQLISLSIRITQDVTYWGCTSDEDRTLYLCVYVCVLTNSVQEGGNSFFPFSIHTNFLISLSTLHLKTSSLLRGAS